MDNYQIPQDFRTWIMNRKSEAYQTVKEDEDHYQLVTDYATAEINIYEMSPDPEIVELRIVNRKDEEVKFFLHFALTDLNHARELVEEMISMLVNLKHHQKVPVLLSCTSGLTTSYFAEQMNEAANLLSMDLTFSAVPIRDIYEKGQNQGAILLAPQVAYEYPKVKKVFTDIPVIRIPAQIFGTYNAGAAVQLVDTELKNFCKEQEKQPGELVRKKDNDRKILVLTSIPNGSYAHLIYRTYDHGKIVKKGEVIKESLNLRDIEDVLDTQICPCRNETPDAVGLAVSGAIQNGIIDLPESCHMNLQLEGHDNYSDIGKYLEDKYHIPFDIHNNTNSAAVGYYAMQDRYDNITFLSQPIGWVMGGQGIVIDGKLHEGNHGIAGEIKYVKDFISYSKSPQALAWDPDGMLEIVAKSLVVNIAMVDPQVILVRSDLTPDMDLLKKKLSEYIPQRNLPDLIYVKDASDYMLTGEMLLTLNRLENLNQHEE